MGMGPDSMNLQRSPSVDHTDNFQLVCLGKLLLVYGMNQTL